MEPLAQSIVISMTILNILNDRGGWWVQFEGSGERICFGQEHPGWVVGEEIEVVFRRKKS